MKDNYQISLKVIMKNKKGEVLGVKPPPSSSLHGSYEFPGGRIDTNEFKNSFNKIVHRELSEELGKIKYKLYPKPVSLGRHLTPKGDRILYVFFKADYLSGKIKLSDEHKGYDWLDLKKIILNKAFKSGNLEGIKMYLEK